VTGPPVAVSLSVPREPFVFLCHASEDKSFARSLRVELEGLGVTSWLDERDIGVGEPLPERISEALVNCRAAVAVLTPAFFTKRYAMRELFALIHVELTTGRRRVVPLRVGISAIEVLEREPLVGSLKSESVATPSAGARAVVGALEDFAPVERLDNALFDKLRRDIEGADARGAPATPRVQVERQRAARDWAARPRCPKCGGPLVDAGSHAVCDSCALVSAL
jgi:hypothetical protein